MAESSIPSTAASAPPSRPRPVFLACMGDANDADTWSAIPYHFLEAARAVGMIDQGLNLRANTPLISFRRISWNLGKVIRFAQRGGFQYSMGFLDSAWKPLEPRLHNSVIINHFQLYPGSIVADRAIEKWFYLDGTLKMLFDYYQKKIDPHYRVDILRRESEGYHAAAGIMTMSKYAADSVVSDYGIPRAKVHVVIPGANIRIADYAAWEQSAGFAEVPVSHLPEQPLRLVTVGKYLERKGIDRLLRALQLLDRRGITMKLRIIGCPIEHAPRALRAVPNVQWHGFLSRQTEAQRFLKLVADNDLGCLLSRIEFAGIALREYLALGLPVLGPDTGGSPDQVDEACSILIKPDATDDVIADILAALDKDRPRLHAMQKVSRTRRRDALWSSSVARIAAFWPHGMQT